jgi:hypothetical protein
MNKGLRVLMLALVLLIGGGITGGVAQAYTNFSLSFGFHDALAPYGSWVNYGSYGQVWHPYASAGFVPYTQGHWVYTSYGPTWQGNEPWAWAAYHYGHWVFTPQYGWIWVPGYTWTPGAVNWAYGDNYIGWTPYQGNGYGYGGGYGYGNGYGNGYGYGGYPTSNANFWVMIDAGHFGYDNYAPYRLGYSNVQNILARRMVTFHPRMERVALERIVRRPIRVEPIETRTVTVDRHTTRLVVPTNHRDTVLREVTRASERERDRNRNADRDRQHSATLPSNSRNVEHRNEPVRRTEPVRQFHPTNNDHNVNNNNNHGRVMEERHTDQHRTVDQHRTMEQHRTIEPKRTYEPRRVEPVRPDQHRNEVKSSNNDHAKVMEHSRSNNDHNSKNNNSNNTKQKNDKKKDKEKPH